MSTISWLLAFVGILSLVLVVRHIIQMPPSIGPPTLRGFAIAKSESLLADTSPVAIKQGPTILYFKRSQKPQIYSLDTRTSAKLCDPSGEIEELSGSLLFDLNDYRPPFRIRGSAYVYFILHKPDTVEDAIETLPISIGVNALFFRDGILRTLPPRAKRKVLPLNKVISMPLEYELRLSAEHIYPGNRLALAVCLTDLSGKEHQLNCRLLSFGISLKRVESETTSITCWPVDSTANTQDILARLGVASAADKKLLNSIFTNVLQLPESFKRQVIDSISIKYHVPSNPTLINWGEKGIVRIIRLVNYYMLDHLIRIEPRVYTSQYAMYLNGEWSMLKYDTESPIVKASRGFGSSMVCSGVEDIRVFYDKSGDGKLLFIGGTRDYTTNGEHTMVMGEIDINTKTLVLTRQFQPLFKVEKNHAAIIGTNLVVHSWCPLRIYDITTSTIQKLDIVHNIPESELPGCFHDMRGSSCGVPYPSTGKPREYWFLIHWSFAHLHRREAKYYTHAFVRLDAETFRPVGYTVPFIFERGSIEFSCGMAFINDDKTMLVSYSIEDANPTDVHVPVDWILSSEISVRMQSSATEKCITAQEDTSSATISNPVPVEL